MKITYLLQKQRTQIFLSCAFWTSGVEELKNNM